MISGRIQGSASLATARRALNRFGSYRAMERSAQLKGSVWVIRDRDASLAEDAKRLSGEAVAARAAESGIAQGQEP